MRLYFNVFFILLFFTSTAQIPSYISSNGLAAYYPFNGNANDLSGNNNNPTYNNATLTSDRQGNLNSAYHFNGVDNYMRILNSTTLNFGTQMSIAVWVKPTGFYTGSCYNNIMLMKGDADYLAGNYFLRFSDIYTGCTNPNTALERFYGSNVVADSPFVQLNKWYFVVWTCDGVNTKIYIDGVLKNTSIISNPNFTNSYDLFIGRLNNAQYPYWLNGDLDEVLIYDFF